MQSLQKATDLLAELILKLRNRSAPISGSDIMCCIQALEEFSFKFAENFLSSSSSRNISLETEYVVFQAKLIKNNATQNVIFPSKNVSQYGASIFIPKDIFKKYGGVVVSILYKDLHVYLKKMSFNLTKLESVGSNVISTSIKVKTNRLAKNITLQFKTHNSDNLPVKPNCAFWKYAQESRSKSGWSGEGCTLTKTDNKMVECSCNHLTNFAVLMSVDDQQISSSDQGVLSVLTYIGIGISLLGCFLMLALHFAFVNVRAQLCQIHINLVISIAIGQIIFIAGINATENLAGCVCVAALIQYFYLVAFCWMLIEGIQLYLRIVKVFNVEHGMPACYGFAWGLPLVIVLATIAVTVSTEVGLQGFVHNKFCWLSFENKLAWTFVGPVLAITLVNIILLSHVIREMSRMDKAMVGLTPQLETVRKTAKACAVLFPLLGVTWLFGVLTMSEVGVAAQYIFTIMNSIQGFLIFLFNCVRNSEIRSKVKAKFQYFHRPKTPSTIVPSPNPEPLRQESDNKVTMMAFKKRSTDLPTEEQVLNKKGNDIKEKGNVKQSKKNNKCARKQVNKKESKLEKKRNAKKV